MWRSSRLRVASNLNRGYEKRVCCPERTTVPRKREKDIGRVAQRGGGMESRWWNERGIGSVRWKMPVILGNWSRTPSFERQRVAAAAGLISVDQPQWEIYVSAEIYTPCAQSSMNARGLRPEKNMPLFRIRRCLVLSRFHLCDVFATRARLHVDSIPNRKRQRIH